MTTPIIERQRWIDAGLYMVPKQWRTYIEPQFNILMDRIDELEEKLSAAELEFIKKNAHRMVPDLPSLSRIDAYYTKGDKEQKPLISSRKKS